jgi:hypothetical protein
MTGRWKSFLNSNLESMSMEEHERIFLDILRYVNFIQYGKVKM